MGSQDNIASHQVLGAAVNSGNLDVFENLLERRGGGQPRAGNALPAQPRLAMNLASALVAGAVGGAAGTTALNAVTYLDMAVRGRSTSSAPEDSIEALVSRTGLRIPGEEDTRKNRVAGLGPLSGIFVGVGVGAVLGLARTAGWRPHVLTAGLVTGLGAMAATDGPLAALGTTDPRTWTLMDWLSDAVPHLAYGLATAAVAQALDPD